MHRYYNFQLYQLRPSATPPKAIRYTPDFGMSRDQPEPGSLPQRRA